MFDFVTPWTVAHKTPPSMGFSWQEYQCWLPFPSPGDLSHPQIELTSPALTGGFFTAEPLSDNILLKQPVILFTESSFL